MSGINDLVALKLKKALLEDKVNMTSDKIVRLGSILKKKIILATNQGHSNLPDEKTMVMERFVVSDFRQTTRTTKALPSIPQCRDVDDIRICLKPAHITDIHQKHLLRTVGRRDVTQLKKKQSEKRMERELQNAPKKYPSVKIPESLFPNRYVRGELPCTIEHGVSGHYLSWACPLENLDYEYYLPLFFDGLQCKDQPICFLARQGVEDMLFASRGNPNRVRPCIKILVRPLRNALSKFDPDVLLGVLKAIQQLLKANPTLGEELVNYSKQFLAPMAMFLEMDKNLGDSIDYGQRRRDDVGEEVRNTLELMEETGGPRALVQIKFSVPTCEPKIDIANRR